jgi:hypothetical protein
MHRSSESIAALAAALAKAQVTLTNPEKSLTATVRTGLMSLGGPSGMHPFPAASTSYAMRWDSTRSPRCRRPPSTKPRKRSR